MLNIEKNIQSIETKQKNGQEKQENNFLYFYPNNHISISALQLFDACPLNFYLRYYLNIKFPEPSRVKLGSQFQAILNAKYADESYKGLLAAIDINERKTASELVKKANSFKNIISIDSPYQVDLGLGIPVKFVPDLVVGLITPNGKSSLVIENKYTSGYYNKNMVNEQKQGTVYYIGIKKIYGLETNVIYQIFNHKSKKVELIEVERKTQKDIDTLLFWMDKKLSQIEKCNNTGIWDIGSHSKFICDLGPNCPVNYKVS
mgnify:CR=1 FL=1